MSPIRVVIVDDQQLMLQALKVFVSAAQDMTVVGVAHNGVEAIEICAQLRPDVVLMDLQMPVLNGIDATRRVTATQPDVKVIAVTTFAGPEAVVPALRAGAAGYLIKDSEPELLVQSIRDVVEGRNVLSPSVTAALVESVRAQSGAPGAAPREVAPDGLVASLTEREFEVLQLLAEGLSNAEMASELYITESAVKSRVSQLTQKLSVESRVQVLVRACELGLVRPRLRRPPASAEDGS
ncbi:MAG: response regulator transcription factor [Austwickia sp.]|jgi:DNA-binding NarL/FixJ family response regulator|nr:MAG: response regulator transcription factor [Austwickia sp.]